MSIVRAIMLRIRLYHAGHELSSLEPERRARAMDVLTAGGSASLPTLKWLCRVREPLAAFGATVVLHRLGDPAGLQHIMTSLRWILPNSPAMSGYIEEALVQIGPPDASRALIELWQQLPPWDDNHVTLDTICRVFARLQDHRAITPLVTDAHRIPDLFERTIPAFGPKAIPALQQMALEPYPEGRILAIRAIRHIAGDRSRDVLIPMLRDSDATVRGDAARALDVVAGTYVAAREIGEAIRAGYSSQPAVEILRNSGYPGLHEPLLALIKRWPSDGSDTFGAVLETLDTLRTVWAPAPRMLSEVCGLIERNPRPDIALAAIRLLGDRAHGEDNGRERARVAMWPLLASPVREIRAQAATGLGRLGDPLGHWMLELLDNCRPHGSLLQKIQIMLRGGPDAGTAASSAIVQLTQWVNRVSRETVERFGVSGAPAPCDAALRDPRLAGLMRALLSGALRSLDSAEGPDAVEEAVSYTAAGIRVLARLGPEAVRSERAMLVVALRAVKCVVIPADEERRQQASYQEVAALVRMSAADAIVQLGPDETLSLLMETAAIADAYAGTTAITALGRIGDPRAIPYLQGVVANGSDVRADAAREALAAIRRTNPAAMTLLRPSSVAEAHADRLVRPAYGISDSKSAELLLRPSISEE